MIIKNPPKGIRWGARAHNCMMIFLTGIHAPLDPRTAWSAQRSVRVGAIFFGFYLSWCGEVRVFQKLFGTGSVRYKNSEEVILTEMMMDG